MASDEVVMHLTQAVRDLTEAVREMNGLLGKLDRAAAQCEVDK